MGTWDATAFGNDDASAFAAEVVEDGDDELLAEALQAAADADDYLEAPECQQAIAAAEVVAAMNGRAGSALPEGLAVWAMRRGKASRRLTVLARRAVERVASNSELKELWEEGDASEWVAHVDELQKRLS